jgi:hypothetical protein
MSADLIARIRENVPQMLRDLPVWLLHDAEKKPIYADGTNRRGTLDSPEDRAMLVTFEEAAAALPRVRRACGLGVALGEVPGEDIHISGIDGDRCLRNDEIDDRFVQILGAAVSYAERSPSGTGLHILGLGDIGTLKIPHTDTEPGLEMYSGLRFFTVTGERINGAHVVDITEAATLARQLFEGEEPERTAPAAGSATPPVDPDGIIPALMHAGLYLRDAGNGKHLIRCPWEARHTPNETGERNTSSSEAAYFGPGAVVRGTRLNTGMFRCQHAHCADRRLRHLREFLGLEEPKPAPDPGEWTPPAVVSYGAGFDPAAIPKRRWLLGRRRSVGELTIDAGPPGVNKSTLLLSDAVQIATGRQILADDVHERGGVLFLAGEDARRDVEARLAGILARHHIEPAELEGRLHLVYLAEIDATAYSLAEMIADMAVLNTRMFDWLREYPDTLAIFIDPVVAWHRLIENSNEALQLLCSSLRSLAVRGQRHVGFDHHVTKVSQFDCEAHVGNLAALRGAGAIGAAARWAFTMARIKTETAAAHGIEETERARYRRLDALKASYGPDDEGERLLRVESVPIANGETVGVLVEVDTQRTREQAAERREMASADARARLTAALLKMLREKAPRSASEAALWLATREPSLYFDEKKRAPLSERTVYRRLAVDIGEGLDAGTAGNPLRIVLRVAGKGNGARREIDFEQGRIA